jgi:hypothetical protein
MEILDLPLKNGDFHSKLLVYQRVSPFSETNGFSSHVALVAGLDIYSSYRGMLGSGGNGRMEGLWFTQTGTGPSK